MFCNHALDLRLGFNFTYSLVNLLHVACGLNSTFNFFFFFLAQRVAHNCNMQGNECATEFRAVLVLHKSCVHFVLQNLNPMFHMIE
jgi:hypothetical protein